MRFTDDVHSLVYITWLDITVPAIQIHNIWKDGYEQIKSKKLKKEESGTHKIKDTIKES